MDRPSEDEYRTRVGLIVICMYCKRTLREMPGENEWVLVEAFIAQPPRHVSHGLCPDCLEKHYPADQK
jgi:hypothetical protein